MFWLGTLGPMPVYKTRGRNWATTRLRHAFQWGKELGETRVCITANAKTKKEREKGEGEEKGRRKKKKISIMSELERRRGEMMERAEIVHGETI